MYQLILKSSLCRFHGNQGLSNKSQSFVALAAKGKRYPTGLFFKYLISIKSFYDLTKRSKMIKTVPEIPTV